MLKSMRLDMNAPSTMVYEEMNSIIAIDGSSYITGVQADLAQSISTCPSAHLVDVQDIPAEYHDAVDFMVANLEVTLGGEAAGKYQGYPTFNCPDSMIDALKDAGVDMTGPEPVEQALELFGQLLDEMEELAGEL